MNSSFSRSLRGVSSRMSSARSRVWSGWSMVTMCSLCGSRCRYRSMSSLTSSPANGSGKLANGPTTVLQAENVSCRRSISEASWYPVTAMTP